MRENFSLTQKQQMNNYKNISVPLIADSEFVQTKINDLTMPSVIDSNLYNSIAPPFTKNINRYKTLYQLSSTVTNCDDGNYYDPTTKECIICPSGSYCSSAMKNDCTPGYYNPSTKSTNSSSCLGCPGGTFSDKNASSVCSDCLAGTYQDITGQTSCKQVPIGTYTNKNKSAKPIDCLPGTYQDLEGQTSCKQAPMGTYISSNRATTPLKCNNQYNDVTGQAQCKNCNSATNGVTGYPADINNLLGGSKDTNGNIIGATNCKGVWRTYRTEKNILGQETKYYGPNEWNSTCFWWGWPINAWTGSKTRGVECSENDKSKCTGPIPSSTGNC